MRVKGRARAQKGLGMLLCLLLLLPLLAQAQDYSASFRDGLDGWFARSLGSARLEVDGDALTILGREADWHSPGRIFPLLPGQDYQISVQVRQDQQQSADLMLSIAHSKNGRESYENLARASVPIGEWTTLSAAYSAGSFDQNILYVETLGSPGLIYSIRNFILEAQGMQYPMDIPRLKDIYKPYFPFGNSLTQKEALNPQTMAFYASQFNIMTHGNELKPDSVLDVAASRDLARQDQGAVAVKFDAARPLLDFAWNHGIKIHGHVLLWHNQTPEVFFREGYSTTGPFVSREVMLARMDNYIRLVFEGLSRKYPGLIVSFDVVNEAIDDNTGKLRESHWTRIVGEDYIHLAFRAARQYAPAYTKLYYNDYSTPYQPKLTGILTLLKELEAEGNIDGHGFQCHYHLNTPSLLQVQEAMDQIIALGLRLRMSEMDILIDRPDQANLQSQANRYRDFLALFRQYKDHIDAVHTWGVVDNLSWKASNHPLLFDQDAQPKPAFYAIIEGLE